MFQTRTKTQKSFFAHMSIIILALGTFLVLLAGCGTQQATQTTQTAYTQRYQTLPHVQAKLNIVINQPGMQKDWPAYSPTNLVVPANSLVTITLHDYDSGSTALPSNTPFSTVQGTVGNRAYVNGVPYTSVAPDKIAHTFTIAQLHINVPLPGDGPSTDAITFTIRTGHAGTYMFECFDPCGTGSSGWEGPMMTRGYMMGTLTVQ